MKTIKPRSLLRPLLSSLMAICVWWLAWPLHAEESTAETPFDHTATRFPLMGAHRIARCESCHIDGQFAGTPTDCNSCHSSGSRRAQTSKPLNHLITLAACSDCHNNNSWLGARFDHVSVMPGSCTNCHNGSSASGKPAHHVQTTSSCDSCHRTQAWIPAGFNHAQVTPGTCITCHNGSIASGKPANHITTTATCDACHRTTAWIPASFNHSNVASGTCNSCHNGSQATGMPSGHFVTTKSCDACHRTSAWEPVSNYLHTSAAYKQHRSNVNCDMCHTSKNEVIAWPFAAYRPDCAGCHANRFKTDPHTKTQNPKTFYTVSELKDCAGSCHVYSDATMTTIIKSRSGEHKASGGDF